MANMYLYVTKGVPKIGTVLALNKKDYLEQIDDHNLSIRWTAELGSSKLVRTLFENKASTKLKKKDILMFIRYLSFGINQGLTQAQALELILEAGNKRVARLVRAVKKRLNEGEQLDQALLMSGMDKDICFRITLALKSNKLGLMLSELDQELIESWDFKKKMITSLIYPIILIILMIAMVLIMSGYIMPAISEILADLDAELPAVTTAVLDAGQKVIKVAFIEGIILAIIIPIHIIAMRNKKYKYFVGKQIFKVPVIGSILTYIKTTSIITDMHHLLDSGVDTVEALDIIRVNQRSYYVRETLKDVMDTMVQEGTPVDQAMKDLRYLTVQSKQFIRIGVESGGLVKVLKSVSTNTKKEFNLAIKAWVAILEPTIMMVVLSTGGTLIYAVATALNSINDAI